MTPTSRFFMTTMTTMTTMTENRPTGQVNPSQARTSLTAGSHLFTVKVLS